MCFAVMMGREEAGWGLMRHVTVNRTLWYTGKELSSAWNEEGGPQAWGVKKCKKSAEKEKQRGTVGARGDAQRVKREQTVQAHGHHEENN